MICSTNAIESINARLRKITTRERFPSDDAESKLIWQALRISRLTVAAVRNSGRMP